jgi:hypothetical protein
LFWNIYIFSSCKSSDDSFLHGIFKKTRFVALGLSSSTLTHSIDAELFLYYYKLMMDLQVAEFSQTYWELNYPTCGTSLWLSIEFSYKYSEWVHILTISQPLQMHAEHLWPMQCEEGGLYFLMQWDPLLTFLKKEESNKTQNVPTRQIFTTSRQLIIPLCDSFKGVFGQKKCTKVRNSWNLHI